MEVGRPARSTHSCVRSFWPGSSFAPAVSLVQTNAACTAENANTATPTARSDATTITSINRDLAASPDLFERSRKDESIEGLLSQLKNAYRTDCTNLISVSIY
jgi:hypothetical protein